MTDQLNTTSNSIDLGLVSKKNKASKSKINNENKDVYIIAVYILGLIVTISAIAAICFAAYDKEMPNSLVALGSVAIGALATLFTHK